MICERVVGGMVTAMACQLQPRRFESRLRLRGFGGVVVTPLAFHLHSTFIPSKVDSNPVLM